MRLHGGTRHRNKAIAIEDLKTKSGFYNKIFSATDIVDAHYLIPCILPQVLFVPQIPERKHSS
jgi:hypothetical protein